MVFLRAFGLTQFSGSQQTRNPNASEARRRRSTRFLQAKGRYSGVCNGIWGNCLGPAQDTPYRRLEHALARADAFNGASERGHESRLATRCHANARKGAAIRMADLMCTERVTAARTVCLRARRRLKMRARASCRSGGETDRRSTTATVQGISPFCDDRRILDILRTKSQPDSLSRANIMKIASTSPF